NRNDSTLQPYVYASYLPEYPDCFFSSRRRHTRFSRDWSSDVCSSDLRLTMAYPLAAWLLFCVFCFFPLPPAQAAGPEPPGLLLRSEERRVGKECRSEGWKQR